MNRLRLGTAVVALCALTLAGCGNEEPSPGPDPTPSTTLSDTGAPSDSPTDETEPATGKEMATETFVLRAPEGWTVERNSMPGIFHGWNANEPDALGTVSMSDLGDMGVATPEELAEFGYLAFPRRPGPEVSFDAELGGEPAYYAHGEDEVTETHEYGGVRDGMAANVIFELYKSVPAKERREIIDSVLASFEWN